ncbi:hypothetical protein TTHERM_001002731 (macronuclear) [Tetrahymena thermophila SB210]|uniref:Uncharacterized protein n=1 Tax=Tetrahymena thermophila (strain SB210) TaxID=312017 RepID=W7WXH9_TETTS|nr:hypothetical protein TTHERM_001002731 [Tetrahymena thermophila SB210]EWS71510.1 hypothetical protein TTHERM_001002731 [Tetrahymena thermophila SB210]|eukprot:XP_012655955.1 hypothetical protein TTHERM_001002731 [Tetrahymena thermophila SB210]
MRYRQFQNSSQTHSSSSNIINHLEAFYFYLIYKKYFLKYRKTRIIIIKLKKKIIKLILKDYLNKRKRKKEKINLINKHNKQKDNQINQLIKIYKQYKIKIKQKKSKQIHYKANLFL